MRRYLLAFVAVAIVSAVALLALSPSRNVEAAGPRVISAFGKAQVQGQEVVVHVVVVVPPGLSDQAAAHAALAAQGARPFSSADFTTSGLVWDQFSDASTTNDFVTQNYNPADAPVGIPRSALTTTQGTWTNVSGSTFVLADGGDTSRCPSLVKQCKGRQTFDGNNDVAWLSLGPNTLGVTWYGTSTDEADMALNTRFDWANDFDAETVFLHENGHVVGLGHEDDVPSVMATYYSGVERSLYQDDIDGITALYPSGATNDAPAVSISSPTDGATFDSGSTISFGGSASDTEDGALTASLVWTAGGVTIGAGGSFSATLNDGNHTITASVTDSGGATGSDSITITVGSPPPSGSTVTVDSITYSTSGGRNGDKHLSVTIGLKDDFGDAVANASVSIVLSRDGSAVGSGTSTTGTGGTVTFTLSNARRGVYTTDVTDVTAPGLTWDGLTPFNSFTK